MASYHVVLTSSAEKELKRLSSQLIARMIGRLESLASNPRPPGCKKLKGGDKEWRIRVGDYRVVYDRAPARCLSITAHPAMRNYAVVIELAARGKNRSLAVTAR